MDDLLRTLDLAISARVAAVQDATPPLVRLAGCVHSLSSHRAKKDKLTAELSTLLQRVDRIRGLLPRIDDSID
eukprot:2734828-Prorocentrum_lima.AAC.1